MSGFVEVSLDGAHAPMSSGTAADVLAFGFPMGTNLMVFDGLNWIDSGLDFAADLKWTITRLHVYDTYAIAEANGVFSGPIALEYTGSFNTISVRNEYNDGTWRTIDDVWVANGMLVPEPSTMVLLGFAGLLLSRRRR